MDPGRETGWRDGRQPAQRRLDEAPRRLRGPRAVELPAEALPEQAEIPVSPEPRDWARGMQPAGRSPALRLAGAVPRRVVGPQEADSEPRPASEAANLGGLDWALGWERVGSTVRAIPAGLPAGGGLPAARRVPALAEAAAVPAKDLPPPPERASPVPAHPPYAPRKLRCTPCSAPAHPRPEPWRDPRDTPSHSWGR